MISPDGPTEAAAPGIERLFVSVGTDYHRFDRLIRWVDEWLERGPDVRHVVVQRGTSIDCERADSSLDYIQRSQLIVEFQHATVVVCHGGPATILECRSNGVVPIVVPREEKFNEHVNDHQVDFCERLAAHHDIQLARTKDEFFRLLDLAVVRGAPEVAVDDGHTAESLDNFELAMIDLLGDRARTTLDATAAAVIHLTDTEPTIPVLFLGAVPRSGSTIVSDLLNEHPHMVNLGEVVHLWQRGMVEDNLCGCGEPFSSCPFWVKVGDQAFGGWDKISGERMQTLKNRADRTRFIPALLSSRPVPVLATSIRQYGSVVGRILHAVKEVSGAPVLVDTSKHVSTALFLHQIPAVDLRILHLVRDPRGVAHSWSKNVHRPEVTAGEQRMDRLHPGRVGLRWLWFNWAFSNMGRLDIPVQVVRYEDFVSDPAELMNQIFSFAEVEEVADELLHDGEPFFLSEGHSVAGNPRRLDRKPVEIRVDENWRAELDPKMAALVSSVTRPLRGRFNYSKDH